MKKSTHYEVIEMVLSYALSIGFSVLNLDFSPIKGPEGNIEYLVHLQKTEQTDTIEHVEIDWKQIVENAFSTIGKIKIEDRRWISFISLQTKAKTGSL